MNNYKSMTAAVLASLIVSTAGCGGSSGSSNDAQAADTKKILFLNDGVHGIEPWITDGTNEGTKLLKDIRSEGSSVNTSEVTTYKLGDKWFFFAKDDSVEGIKSGGYQLWSTDGTEAGTSVAAELGSTVLPYGESGVIYNNKLYFSMRLREEGADKGYELWSTDGTKAGTAIVADICPNTCSSYPRNFTVLNNKLYFTAEDGVSGNELWMSDGTESGTKLVKNIYPEPLIIETGDETVKAIQPAIASSARSSNPSYLTAFNNKLYFAANNGVNGVELWVSDGTSDGTILLKEFLPDSASGSPNRFKVVGDKLYFNAKKAGTNQNYLYVSDGTAEGTNLLLDNNESSIYMGNLSVKTQINGELYFTSGNVWKTDGTPDNTLLLTNNLSRVYSLIAIGNKAYMSATNRSSGYGNEIYYTNVSASEATAASVIDINTQTVSVKSVAKTAVVEAVEEVSNTQSSYPKMLFTLKGKLYFMANDGIHGYELWMVDPETNEASLVKDINTTGDGIGSYVSGGH